MSDDLETLSRLYLELANVVPRACKSSREIVLERRIGDLEDFIRDARLVGRFRLSPEWEARFSALKIP